MNLPSQITPNPLINSMVEIRFESSLSEEEVLPTLFPIFSKEFPKLKERHIPIEIKQQDSDLRYAANYVFSNDKYSVFIDNNVIGFENVNNEYQLWTNYFPVIMENINTLKNLNIISKVERIGVRYSSLFENINSFSEILTIDIKFPYPEYVESDYVFKTQLKKGNVILLLQLVQNATVQQIEKMKTGILIDIDASISDNIENSTNEHIFSLINQLHFEEKKLFFSLINEKFLATLNPQYK